MVQSAVGVINEVKMRKDGRIAYVVDFKDQDGVIHRTTSYATKTAKYSEGDSISIRFYSFKVFGYNVIITDKIDDEDQKDDKAIVISGASLIGAGIIAGTVLLIVDLVGSAMKKAD